jgi:transposase
VIYDEPDNTQCPCGCQLQRIGEDVSEKLDYTPGVFTVEQHVVGKLACRQCETLIQAPLPSQVIYKGIPTAGVLAHVKVAKFADHLPLYRQEKIFGHTSLAISRSTLAQWGGQTGVQLQPLVDALREAVLAQHVVHAGTNAGSRREEYPPRLRLGLQQHAILGTQGRGLRFQPQPYRRTCA